MRVDFSAQSRADLRAIIFFIAADNPIPQKDTRLSTVDQRATFIGMPYRNYSIFYQNRVDHIVVVRIVHGAIVTDEFLSNLAT